MREFDFKKFTTEKLEEVIKRDDLGLSEVELYDKLIESKQLDPRLLKCVRFENMTRDTFLDKVFPKDHLTLEEKDSFLKQILESKSSRSHRGDILTVDPSTGVVNWRVFINKNELSLSNPKKVIRVSSWFSLFNCKWKLAIEHDTRKKKNIYNNKLINEKYQDITLYSSYINMDSVPLKLKYEIGGGTNKIIASKDDTVDPVKWCTLVLGNGISPNLINVYNPAGYLDIKIEIELDKTKRYQF